MDRNVAQASARWLPWKGWSNESPFKQQIRKIRTRLGNWGILNNKPKKRLGNWEISNHKSGQGWEWEIGEQNKHFKLTDSNSFPSTITFSPCFFWRKFGETRITIITYDLQPDDERCNQKRIDLYICNGVAIIYHSLTKQVNSMYHQNTLAMGGMYTTNAQRPENPSCPPQC